MSATGKEIQDHAPELERILLKIMTAHTIRKGCGWRAGAVQAIIADLAVAIEKQEICIIGGTNAGTSNSTIINHCMSGS